MSDSETKPQLSLVPTKGSSGLDAKLLDSSGGEDAGDLDDKPLSLDRLWEQLLCRLPKPAARWLFTWGTLTGFILAALLFLMIATVVSVLLFAFIQPGSHKVFHLSGMGVVTVAIFFGAFLLFVGTRLLGIGRKPRRD